MRGARTLLLALSVLAIPECKPRPKEAKVTSAFVGRDSLCVKLDSGAVRCAGSGSGLGDAVRAAGGKFVDVPEFANASEIALGKKDGCSLKYGVVTCFGESFQASVEKPKHIGSGYSLVASDSFFCSQIENLATCFPEANVPQSWQTAVQSTGVMHDAIAVAAGGNSVCVISQAHLARCYGSLDGVTIPDVLRVAVNGDRVCATRNDGSYTCATVANKTPTAPKTAFARYATLTSAGLCIVHASRTVSCEDEKGTLAPLPGVFAVVGIAAGGDDTCIINADHVLSCFGANGGGELGTAAGAKRDVPTPIFFPATP